MSIDALSMLCASTLTYCEPSGVSSSLDKLTRSEFAGLLAGLSPLYFDFALAKYCLDDPALSRFINGIAQEIPESASSVQFSLLLIHSSIEVIRPQRCRKCEGRKFVGSKLCPSCEGLGSLRYSGRKIAETIEVSESAWRRQWLRLYNQLITYIQDIDSQIKIHYSIANKTDCSVYM